MKHVVCLASEIPPGERKIVDVAGLTIGIFNLSGEFFALRNRCPHQGGPLCDGLLWGLLESPAPGQFSYTRKGEILTCGWHGWEFDVRTGQSYCEPRRLRARAYEVSVEDLSPTRVKGPYMAETYPVTTDGEYVVVEIAG